MLIDCLPVSTMACIPARYARVWEYDGIVIRVDRDGHAIKVRQSDVRRAGARIHLGGGDDVFDQTVAGLGVRRFGATRVYYTRTCRALGCIFSFVIADPAHQQGIERCGAERQRLGVEGASRAGLRRALGSIRLRIAGVPLSKNPTLASFAEHADTGEGHLPADCPRVRLGARG